MAKSIEQHMAEFLSSQPADYQRSCFRMWQARYGDAFVKQVKKLMGIK